LTRANNGREGIALCGHPDSPIDTFLEIGMV